MNEITESLKQRIDTDVKTAMRAKDKPRLNALRLILAAIKQREVDERIPSLDDTQVIAILDKMLKQRRESIQQYTAGGRQDLADREAFEVEVIQAYLPAALSEVEISALIEETLSKTGATSPQDMGKVMRLLKPRMQGRADMKTVSHQVKQRLAQE
jgi:uncharacterized protein YqeY